MATNIYNFTNQKLNADKLREVQKFNSDNFGGIISNVSPIKINGSTVKLEASKESPVMMMGGGSLLLQDSEVTTNIPSVNELWYLQVILNEDGASIVRDTLENEQITFKQAMCSYMKKNNDYTFFSVITEAEGSPAEQEYYVYNGENEYTRSDDSEVDENKVYYYKVESTSFSFRFNDSSTVYSYLGNSIWISDRTFIIPLCANINGNVESVVSVRGVQDLEGLFSAEAYAKLKKYCETTFVWTSGGKEKVTDIYGNSHNKGDVGSLNITKNVIDNKNDIDSNSNTPVVISTPAVMDIKSVDQGTNISILDRDKVDEFRDASPQDKIILDEAGKLYRIKDYKVPVSNGGTYLPNNWDSTNPRNSAKQNLGIFYGKNDGKSPSEKNPISSPKEGDIYLWIIE